MTCKPWIAVAVGMMFAMSYDACAEENLLKHAAFEMKDDKLVGWTDRTNPKQKVSVEDAALRVDVTVDGGKNHGQILQAVNVKPNTTYRLEGDVKGGDEGMAYFSIKLIAGKQEGTRLATEANKKLDKWESVSKVFTTAADTTGVQVLCRFRMSAGYVGKTAWWAKPRLVQVGPDGPSAAVSPKAPSVKTSNAAVAANVVAAPGRDAYVSPDGAGTRDGTSWDNALPGNSGGLQQAWDMAGPGNTVHVSGGGVYDKPTLSLHNGGSSLDKPKRLVGVDRGAGRPVFAGNWSKDKPESGPTLITLQPGVSFVEVRDLEIRHYKNVVIAKGPNRGLRITNVDVQDTRDAFWFDGGAAAGEPDSGSHDIVLQDCEITRYTKRALRTLEGVHHMQVVNCVADAGGRDYAAEVFPVGFHLTGNYKSKSPGIADHDITFINCEARNNYHDGGDKYWNADGFAAEGSTYNITFRDCRSFDNTDGGWDVKSVNPRWVNCIAMGNKRNFRIWSKPSTADGPATLENCLSAFATDRGNHGHHAGFWVLTGGDVTLQRCTSWEDPVGLITDTKSDDKLSTVTVDRCIISSTTDGSALRLTAATTLRNTGSAIRAEPGDAAVTLQSPVREWNCGDGAFDAVSDSTLGYRFVKPGS